MTNAWITCIKFHCVYNLTTVVSDSESLTKLHCNIENASAHRAVWEYDRNGSEMFSSKQKIKDSHNIHNGCRSSVGHLAMKVYRFSQPLITQNYCEIDLTRISSKILIKCITIDRCSGIISSKHNGRELLCLPLGGAALARVPHNFGSFL